MIDKFNDPNEPYSNLEVVQAPALALDHGNEPALALDYGNEPALALDYGNEPALALVHGNEPALALDHGFDDPKNLTEVTVAPQKGLEGFEQAEDDDQSDFKAQRKILVAICAIIVGGAVGGAIAGSNAAKVNRAPNNRDQSSPSPSAPSSLPPFSTSSAVTSGTTGLAANSCTSPNAFTYRTASGQKFLVLCFVDMPRGSPTFNSDAVVADINRTITYTLEECMNYCDRYNKNNPPTKCAAVTYNANLTSSVAGQDGNCFLKDRRGVAVASDSLVASASTAD